MVRYVKGQAEPISDEWHSTQFDCRCTRPQCDTTLVEEALIEGLSELVKIFPIIEITSGFRCVWHNKEVGGSPKSQHMLGRAADIKTLFATPAEVANAAERIACFENGGIGRYKSWTHVDVRGQKARWGEN